MNGMDRKKPIYKRQQFLLSFSRAMGNACTATDLQKLVFLYLQKNHSLIYEFVPYKYGCYSFQLAEDVRTLESFGWIKQADSRISYIENSEDSCFNMISEEEYDINKLRGDKLIKKVYKEFPYYAINSTILDRILDEEERCIINKYKMNIRKKTKKLFTIGYEGLTIEYYLNTLIRNDVRILCDVRKNPLSRKFGFSKNSLSKKLPAVGIEYLHLPELGILSEYRSNLSTEADYQRLFKSFRNELPKRKEILTELLNAFENKKRVALTCFEHDPMHCHRHVIRDYLVNNYSIDSEDL